jgi:hypothetical protein
VPRRRQVASHQDCWGRTSSWRPPGQGGTFPGYCVPTSLVWDPTCALLHTTSSRMAVPLVGGSVVQACPSKTHCLAPRAACEWHLGEENSRITQREVTRSNCTPYEEVVGMCLDYTPAGGLGPGLRRRPSDSILRKREERNDISLALDGMEGEILMR